MRIYKELGKQSTGEKKKRMRMYYESQWDNSPHEAVKSLFFFLKKKQNNVAFLRNIDYKKRQYRQFLNTRNVKIDKYRIIKKKYKNVFVFKNFLYIFVNKCKFLLEERRRIFYTKNHVDIKTHLFFFESYCDFLRYDNFTCESQGVFIVKKKPNGVDTAVSQCEQQKWLLVVRKSFKR